MKKYICDRLVLLYYIVSRNYDKIDNLSESFTEANYKFESQLHRIPLLGYFFRVFSLIGIRKQMKESELFDDINYYTNEQLNRASICYIVFLFPLLFIVLYSLVSSLLTFMFYDETILFFREYIKLLVLIPVFLLIFVGLLPFLIFKLVFPKQEKSMKIFTYSALIAIVFPILVFPQGYHYLYAKPIAIEGQVENIYNKSHSSRNNTITFSSTEESLNTMKFSRLQQSIINNATLGEKYVITGKKSRFYFTYDEIRKVE